MSPEPAPRLPANLLQSHRFWLVVAAVIIAVIIGIIVLLSPADDDVKVGALAVLGWALKSLLGAAITSDGDRRMGT